MVPPLIKIKSLQDSAHTPNPQFMHIHYQMMMTSTPQQRQRYLDIPIYSHTGLSNIIRTLSTQYHEPKHLKTDILKNFPSLKEVNPVTAQHRQFTHPFEMTLVDEFSRHMKLCQYDLQVTEHLHTDIINDYINHTLLTTLDVYFAMLDR